MLSVGDTINYEGARFTVERVDRRRIRLGRVKSFA